MRTDGQTDRQTDMTKILASFRNFAKAPKTPSCCYESKYSKDLEVHATVYCESRRELTEILRDRPTEVLCTVAM